jgi:hypothetical protein
MATITKNRNFNSSYLEWRAGLSDKILKGTHPGTIPARFGLIWFSGFRGEDLNVSSPQKPLDQLQPNFGGMVLGWPPFKFCPVIPTSNQDGHQAKNRKKGG